MSRELRFLGCPADGYSCRIGKLKVTINDNSMHIAVFGSCTVIPCETSGECPDDITDDPCPLMESCPHEEEQTVDNLFEWQLGSLAEAEARVKELFKTGSDGIGHRVRWPTAAKVFENSVWSFENNP